MFCRTLALQRTLQRLASSFPCLAIRQRIPETQIADVMLNKLKEECIESIKDLQVITRRMLQDRNWSESEIDIVLLESR